MSRRIKAALALALLTIAVFAGTMAMLSTGAGAQLRGDWQSMTWTPPDQAELQELKLLMLKLTNEERAKHGAQPLTLGLNPYPQAHAEQSTLNCYVSHWDLQGMKPGHRYGLTGGTQYSDENVTGYSYCPQGEKGNQQLNRRELWPKMVEDSVRAWIESPGHHETMIAPHHRVMHAGISIGMYHGTQVQAFSGDYVRWTQEPGIPGGRLTMTGVLQDARFPSLGERNIVSVTHHPPTARLTAGQLARTSCYSADRTVAVIERPLRPGHFYRTGDGRPYKKYTEHQAETGSRCQDPYLIDPETSPPEDYEQDLILRQQIKSMMTPEIGTMHRIVADKMDLDTDRTEFAIEADLGPVIQAHGPGIYTVTLWAETAGGNVAPVAEYAMWWNSEPDGSHPYTVDITHQGKE